MTIRRSHISLLLVIIIPFLFSCRATLTLRQDEYLLRKNQIAFRDKNPGINVSEINSIVKPKPNKRFIGFIPIKISLYNMGMRGNPERKFRKWMREKAGERPVIYDSSLVRKSTGEVEQYLAKVGYFNSVVTSSTVFKENKKAFVTYHIVTSTPYRVRSFTHQAEDPVLSGFIGEALEKSRVSEGGIFNMFTLEKERDRISEYLRNEGYYYFNQNFIFYEVDSSLGSHEMDVVLRVKNNELLSGEDPPEVVEAPHRRYVINNIYINTAFDPLNKSPQLFDTILIDPGKVKNGRDKGIYHFVYEDILKIKPVVLTQSIFIRPGDYFNETDIRRTRLRLNELGLFNYSNIGFEDLGPGKTDSLQGKNLLDCSIDLMRRKLHSFTVETEGTNKSGRLGMGLIFSYQNSNIFRGSEIFNFRIRGAIEFQTALSGSNESVSSSRLISTYEYGGEVSINFPKFLVPFRQQIFPRYFRPRTVLRLALSYENRPEYERTITNVSFGYDWRQSDVISHQLFPIVINFVDILPSPEFEEELAAEPNDRIRNQYTDHMIMALDYNFVYNNQKLSKYQNFLYYRGNIEPAGNLLQLFYSLFGTRKDSSDFYTILGIRYSQYFRTDHDFRYFYFINKGNSIASRVYFGIGIPYGNDDVLPLEKGFYGGGANGIRAWPLRLLGPGSYYNPDDFFDRSGDLHLETNLEYRFTIYKFFKGAAFVDVGNVWLLKENESYPDGEFRFDKFFRDLAVGTGLGARFDFDFFVFRLDFAARTKDPSLPEGSRWVIKDLQFKDIIVNFAIGYPF